MSNRLLTALLVPVLLLAACSSGGAEAILDTVAQAAADGVELVTVGFGLDGFNDPAAWAMHLHDNDSARYSDVADLVERLADDLDTDATHELAELVERSS